MAAEIVIVDYGMGNLRSVQKAFETVGHTAAISSDLTVIANATKLVLPGVGAFKDAIAKLNETGLADVLKTHIQNGRPFLGICLGMQLLFTRSLEDGVHAGLDVLPGEVVPFTPQPGLKIPHMGWNTLKWEQPTCPLWNGLEPESAVYFVHGYYCKPFDKQIISATAEYPKPFCAAIAKDNVLATQYHPEKSQRVGLQMIKNFALWMR